MYFAACHLATLLISGIMERLSRNQEIFSAIACGDRIGRNPVLPSRIKSDPPLFSVIIKGSPWLMASCMTSDPSSTLLIILSCHLLLKLSQIIPVAMAAFSDSALPYFGIVIRSVIKPASSLDIPLDSFPITIRPPLPKSTV